MGNNAQYAFDYIEALVNKGFQLMFGDFSLKYLIKNWDSEKLGKNPFVLMGE